MATVKAIKYGMKGDDVSNLQTSLKNAGYNVDVDGSFGPQTLAAVKQYQQANGLDADGMVGPQTQAKLFGNTSTPTNTSAGTNTGGAGSAASADTKVDYPAPPTYDRYVAPERVVSDNVNKAQAALDAVLADADGLLCDSSSG
jgi:peptidoglycan hydrolase-like protein with peptidoglycan-binding domain